MFRVDAQQIPGAENGLESAETVVPRNSAVSCTSLWKLVCANLDF